MGLRRGENRGEAWLSAVRSYVSTTGVVVRFPRFQQRCRVALPWRASWIAALTAVVACGDGKDDVGGGDLDDVDDVPGNDTDTGPDTGPDTDLPDNVAEVADVEGYDDTTDVAATADAVWMTAFNDDGQAAVARVDLAGGVTEVFAGPPLTVPSGIAISDDGRLLLVSDVASEPWNDATTNGGVYLIDQAGGGATELGTWGVIDLPGDVAFAPDGMVYVSGFTLEGMPAVFSLDLDTGRIVPEIVGEPLVDPLQLDVSPDGSTLYVVDGLAGRGQRAALLAFTLPGLVASRLYEGFSIDFPGGVAAADDGSAVFVSTVRPRGLGASLPDGTGFQALDVVGVFELPNGMSERAGMLYVAETSELGGADIYSVLW